MPEPNKKDCGGVSTKTPDLSEVAPSTDPFDDHCFKLLPIVDGIRQLEKFTGRKGRTYILVPEIEPDKHAHFGQVKVSVRIDGLPLLQCRLIPFGDGKVFLPVNATIRKQIEKSEGDSVHLMLYRINIASGIPPDLLLCLSDAPEAHTRFLKMPLSRQSDFIQYITDAKSDEEMAHRIAVLIDFLTMNQYLNI